VIIIEYNELRGLELVGLQVDCKLFLILICVLHALIILISPSVYCPFLVSIRSLFLVVI
jgi:hypothetical protein